MEIREPSQAKQVVEELLEGKKEVSGLDLDSIGDIGIEGMLVIEEEKV